MSQLHANASARSHTWTHLFVRRALPWVMPIALLVAWQWASSTGLLSSRFLPAPRDVLSAFVKLSISGELWSHVRISTLRALSGFAVGGGLGLELGLLTGSLRWAVTLFDTTLQMIRNIPALALIPLVSFWFGIDEMAKLFLVSLGVFFPIYINTFHGIRSVDRGLLEMGKTYGLSGWRLYREIILPGALPSILVGVRFSLGLMWVILIVAETISARSGIGYMTMNAREFMQTDVMVVGILLYAILGKLADLLAKGLERYWLRWNPAYQTSPYGITLPVTCSSREIAGPDQQCSRGVSMSIKSVSIALGGRTVLENFDVEIAAGEFVAIVGRSGCGKSTLLRSVVGLETPQSGTITLGNRAASNINTNTNDTPDVRIMFQDSRLLPWRRILPNVMLGLDPALIPQARKVLAQVGLAERANDWPATLSGGQRQRVALARALVHDPNLLLLDEPLGSLDALTRIEMQQLIEDVWRSRGFTAMLVTHDVAEAIGLADRVILIEGGRVALDEAVNIPRPRTRGSARFAALEERILGRVLQRRPVVEDQW